MEMIAPIPDEVLPDEAAGRAFSRDFGPYKGEMYRQQRGLVQLDGDHTGSVPPGAEVLVRQFPTDAFPVRMVLVSPKRGRFKRPVWVVRPPRRGE